MAHIAILHGWSDTSRSFRNLERFLGQQIQPPATIHLGDYISLDDDVQVEDVAIRMQVVVESMLSAGTLERPFDLIVHSTGGLVAREWIARYYPDGQNCPLRRLVMLAPANHGSVLAAKGKSMIGRLAKGWNNWLQVGQGMLNGLELASAYQWELACRDLFDRGGPGGGGPYGFNRIMPFIISGTRGYQDGLRRAVNEDGADGTIRAAAANLNAVGLTMDFSGGAQNPPPVFWPRRNADHDFPFAVLADRDHSSICDPLLATQVAGVTDHLPALILDALTCDSAQRYTQLQQDWYQISEETHALRADADIREDLYDDDRTDPLHQYFQIVIRVIDNHGQPVPDYFVEFYAPEIRGTDDTVVFTQEVLDKVSVNELDESRRCFFIDRTDLLEKFYRLRPDPVSLAISISAAAPGRNIRYFDSQREGANGTIIIHREVVAANAGVQQLLHRNKTHYVEIIIPRQPVDKVFKLG